MSSEPQSNIFSKRHSADGIQSLGAAHKQPGMQTSTYVLQALPMLTCAVKHTSSDRQL
jgi:hypothetical protein